MISLLNDFWVQMSQRAQVQMLLFCSFAIANVYNSLRRIKMNIINLKPFQKVVILYSH